MRRFVATFLLVVPLAYSNAPAMDSSDPPVANEQASKRMLRVLCKHKNLAPIDLEWSPDKTARLFYGNQEAKLGVTYFHPACWKCRAFATVEWGFEFIDQSMPIGWPAPKERNEFRLRRSVEAGDGYGIGGLAVTGYSCASKSSLDDELDGMRIWDPTIPDRRQR